MGSGRFSGAALRRLVRARDLAHDTFDRNVSVAEMANEAGLSRAYFLRSFADVFGMTPHEYVVRRRIEEARLALARGASVTEACMHVGFSSLGTFSRTFSARVGESPRGWQRRVRTLAPSAELWPSAWIPSCFLAYVSEGTFGEARSSRSA
jgi:AraC-like DNA-binding protein